MNVTSTNSSPTLLSLAGQTPGALVKVESPEDESTSQETASDSFSTTSDDESYSTIKFGGRRPSIKLSSLQGEIPVHPATRRSSWKMLPKPDMEKIRRASSLPFQLDAMGDCFSSEELVDDAQKQRRRNVSFQTVQIRSYDQTLGDNPSVSYGPPISLDWKFQEHEPRCIDEFETDRSGERKPFKELGLNYYYRMNLLEHFCGHSREELKAAQRTADRDRLKRAVTKYFLPMQKLEDAAESGLRKTKRMVKGRRSSVA